MKREEKQKKAEELREELSRAKTIILSSYQGLTVSADTELRRKVRASGARYQVVKNTLLKRAAEGTAAGAVSKDLKGTTALAYTAAEPVGLAKVLTDYAKDNPVLVFKAGMVEGRVISLADLQAIGALPPREDLLAKALYVMKAPGNQLATAIAGVARKLAVVIQQGVKENKFQTASGN